FAPVLEGVRDSPFELGRDREFLMVDLSIENRASLMSYRAQQAVGCIGKELNTVFDELCGDVVDRNIGVLQLVHHVFGLGEVCLECIASRSMVAKCVEGGQWYGVDGVGADQLLDIENIAVGLVLRASARPEQALWLRSFGGEPLPTSRVEN